MEEEEFLLPKYLKCTKNEFQDLLKQANKLLKYSNELAENYCNPIIDKNKNYYFLVNHEVLSLVDYNKCITFEEIELIETTL
jgi:hypothetical protein